MTRTSCLSSTSSLTSYLIHTPSTSQTELARRLNRNNSRSAPPTGAQSDQEYGIIMTTERHEICEPVTVSKLRADLRRILATAHYFGPRYMILRNGHAVVAEDDEAEGLPAVGRGRAGGD